MRLFQIVNRYPSYAGRLDRLAGKGASHQQRVDALIADGYAGCHILKPILDNDSNARLVIGDDHPSQSAWANQHGLQKKASLTDVLVAQIEEHQSDTVYNMDAVRFGDDFVRRLPACVKHKIAWRAAPSPHERFFSYDLIVSNFPGIRAEYAASGANTAHFSPSYDPRMDEIAGNDDRHVDLVFIGAYSQYHRQRAEVLQRIASLANRHSIVFHMDRSRLTALADSPAGLLGPLRKLRRPKTVRKVIAPPVFGRESFAALGNAKIVLNGAVDMAGAERGNIRCFEAMGAGALMLSDAGKYPDGMRDGETFVAYSSPEDAAGTVTEILNDWPRYQKIAHKGHAMLRERYSKENQWAAFCELVASIS